MKKALFILGIVLLVFAIGYGAYTFYHRHKAHQTLTSDTKGTGNGKEPQNTPSASAPEFDKTQFSTTDPDSIWVIVNKKHPLNPKDYAPTDLTSVGNNQVMRAEAAKALGIMIAAAKTQGLTISALSGYRSYATQVTVYNNEVSNYGKATADSESARPGYSEHQTGLAVDVGGGGCGIEDCFGNTPEGKWVAANAYQYGFIVRYTSDKVAVTGYRAEPWHVRYIGTDLSMEMQKQGVKTLEEFFGVSGGDYAN